MTPNKLQSFLNSLFAWCVLKYYMTLNANIFEKSRSLKKKCFQKIASCAYNIPKIKVEYTNRKCIYTTDQSLYIVCIYITSIFRSICNKTIWYHEKKRAISYVDSDRIFIYKTIMPAAVWNLSHHHISCNIRKLPPWILHCITIVSSP